MYCSAFAGLYACSRQDADSRQASHGHALLCSSLITKVRRAKTAAEERAIIKKEAAYIRTALSQNLNKYTKRNMIKLMYMRMLGYPVEFGQVPCLALITKGDYSEKARPVHHCAPSTSACSHTP